MSTLTRCCIAAFLMFSALGPVGAADNPEENQFLSLDLNGLLGMNLEVTKGKFTPREAPNIVTVITESEIAASGARDLIDVLRMVPGFDVGVDINSVVDLGIRGNWAHEGKFLLLLDGQPMNELLYGANELGNHYPVDQIKQIEIIRGPGSAIYGGSAELAVISIKTKTAKDVDGLSTTLTAGQTDRGMARRNASFSFGKAAQDLEVTAHYFTGEANRSDKDYTSYYGGTFNYLDNTMMKPLMGNFDVKYKGLDVRYISDQYRNTQRDYWGANLSRPVSNNFDTYIFNAQYDWKIGDKLVVTPRFNRKEGNSYFRSGQGVDSIEMENDPGVLKDKRFETHFWRYTESVTASYDFWKKSNVIVGTELYQDQAEYTHPTLSRGGYDIRFDNKAGFAQATFDTPVVNVTAGGRYEDHSQFGSSFVPRVGLTRVFNKLHLKALYSEAFKVPTIDNINLNPGIKPEKSRFYEVEAGYQFSDSMFLTGNVFDTEIRDAIVYTTTPSGDDYYDNFGKTGTQGAELEYKYLKDWGLVDLTYSFNQVNNNEVDYYKVPGKDKIMLGLPQQKVTLNTQYKIARFVINPSLVGISERYAMDASGTAAVKYDPAVLANLFISYSPINHFTIGAGCFDIGQSSPAIIQPYNGGHAPIPGQSREYVAKLTYDLKF